MTLRIILIVISICLIAVMVLTIFNQDDKPSVKSQQNQEKVGFELLDPEMAPENIRPLVLKGFHIMLETKKYAPKYSGDRLSCTNCHFSAGNTLGGEKSGFSLVGVTRVYPKRLPKGQEYTLAERINHCFLRSMNGKAIPHDSEEMQALLAYLEWISSSVPEGSTLPWLGVKPLATKHRPNGENGGKLFEIYCAMCHGSNGSGQKRKGDLSYPPVWGEHSFNTAAGMNQLPTLADFLYENMPYNYPSLTKEESLDIAAFLISRPRPKFEN